MNYTKATYFIDYEHPTMQQLVEPYKGLSEREKIKQYYIKVRDGWRYNPFDISIEKTHYRSSNIAQKKAGHCIDKAILYVSGLRALGVPARIHLAKVSNHIATERLEATLGTNELAPHGLVGVYHEGQWVKCSPAFNKELCDMYHVDALDFDGTQDSVMQEYNRDQEKFMSYLEDYGHFEDLPYDQIIHIFKSNYPEVYQRWIKGGILN